MGHAPGGGGGTWTGHTKPTDANLVPTLGVTAFAPRSLPPPPPCPRVPPPQERGGGGRRQTWEPKPPIARSRLVGGRVLTPTATPTHGGGPEGLVVDPGLEPTRRQSQTAPGGPFTLGLLQAARGRLAIMLIP